MQTNIAQPEQGFNFKFWALLVGIDCYLPNRLPDGASYKNLSGCVRDINHVEYFLKNTLKLPQAQITKLTASTSDSLNQPKEALEVLPTYENIVTKFNQITDLAQAQDQVYIHYSGHGGRATTIYPDLKGNYGVDETLVPTDIGNPDARYLRDLELAKLLQNMVDKGLIVTLVLDSCHSGGATRGGINDCDIRGLNSNAIDTTPRLKHSLVASAEELVENWQKLTPRKQSTRNINATGGWLPEPKGYVLLAACRDSEYAYEYAFNGKERNGALTYWLLDSLQKLGNGVTYKTLHNRILAKINTQFERQTPMLEGEGDRLVFSGKSISSATSVSVIVKQVDVDNNRVLLQIGAAQGLSKGAEFVIYQLGTTDLTQTQKRVAIAKIVEVDAEVSWAEITKVLRQENPTRTLRLYVPPTTENQKQQTLTPGVIEDGAPALLLSPGIKLVRKVRLLPPQENQQLSGIDSLQALVAIKNAKEKVEGNAWVEFVSVDEDSNEPIAFQVTINSQAEYEIMDAGGEVIYLRSPLKVTDDNAAFSLVNRLVHLVKYQTTLQLDNNDPLSSLAGKLYVELCKPGETRYELLPLNASSNLPTLAVGEYAILRIRNNSQQVLNITVLAIQQDWSIAQIHPSGAGAFEPLDPGKEKLIRVQPSLREDRKEGADILKVFATVGVANFRYLELPVLDQPRKAAQVTRATNPLEKLLAAVASEQPPYRNLSAAAYPSDQWTTEQVKVVVKKI
ncbi:caspase family protein [Nostoc muscorum FACHB-395]|nr:caspase family protein [Desmonostoc muscorum FACHB-395]